MRSILCLVVLCLGCGGAPVTDDRQTKKEVGIQLLELVADPASPLNELAILDVLERPGLIRAYARILNDVRAGRRQNEADRRVLEAFTLRPGDRPRTLVSLVRGRTYKGAVLDALADSTRLALDNDHQRRREFKESVASTLRMRHVLVLYCDLTSNYGPPPNLAELARKHGVSVAEVAGKAEIVKAHCGYLAGLGKDGYRRYVDRLNGYVVAFRRKFQKAPPEIEKKIIRRLDR